MAKSRQANRERHNQYARDWKKKTREAQGLPYVPQGPRDEEYKKRLIENAYDQIIESNARQAFKWWFDKLTFEQTVKWYEAMGKPWLNPRLSDAEKYKIQYANDPEYAIKERLRRQINKAKNNDGIATLIRQALCNGGKSSQVELLLGYSIAELRLHLEKQFTKKMTWEKFMNGEIHIDHVRPKKSFDLSNYEEWKICWGLPNLQPLWARDNLEKSAKLLKML